MSDERGNSHATELFEAIAAGDTARVTALVHEDLCLAALRDEAGVSPVLFALYHDHPDMAELLLAHMPEIDAFEAAALGNVEHLRELLQGNRIGIDARSHDGFTMLHLAAFFGRAQAVSVLLEHGADPDAVAKNDSDLRPIHAAAASASDEIIRQLLSAGADPDARQKGGWTALHAAAKHNLIDMVRLLLAHGADAHTAADEGVTPIDLARAEGHHDIITMLESR